MKEAIESLEVNEVISHYNNEIELLDDNQIDENLLNDLMTSRDLNERGLIYLNIANEKKIYFSPHPYRQNLLNENFSENIRSVSDIIIEKFDQKFCLSEDGEYASVDINVPPVVEHVLEYSKAKNCTILDSISEVRENKHTALFRKYCIDLDNELADRSPRKRIGLINTLLHDLNKITNELSNNIKEGFHYKKRQLNLTKAPVVGKTFEMLGIKNFEFKDPIIKHDYPYLFFINELYNK